MAKFNVNLKKLSSKLSIKYLIFIILIVIGCSYQIIQLTQVFLKFETKVDVKYEQNNKIIIPMISFCKPTIFMFRNSSQNNSPEGFSPAQLYNQTFSFAEAFFGIKIFISNNKYHQIVNFTDEEQYNSEIYYEKTISFETICYHFKYLHSKQLRYKIETIYSIYLYHQNYETISIINNYPYQLFLTANINYPYQADNPLYIFGGNYCRMKYTRTVTHLMPPPYKTKCFDYNKIGCKSRRDCVDRCNIKWAFKHCNGSLPFGTIIDRYNNKDTFKNYCNNDYKEYCEQKHKSPDGTNEYYTIKLEVERKIKELIRNEKIDEYFKSLNITPKSNNKNAKINPNSMSHVKIYFSNEPDTIYTHSPQQYPIEFICLIGGVISLWTGFSVVSIYAYGKRVFNRKQNKIEQINKDNITVNNYIQNNHKHFVFINNKMNDKISSIKKLRKIVKKKNYVINQVNIDQNN